MLKAIVTDINTVDEAHRPFYVEKDGKHVLNVTPVDGFELDDVKGLKSALGAERNIKAQLEAKLKPYEGLDASASRQAMEALAAFGELTPAKAKEAVETAARLSAIDPKNEAERLAAEKITQATTTLQGQFGVREKELTDQIAALQAAGKGLTEQLETLMVGNAIKSELATLNPVDDARDALELLASKSIRTSVKDGKIVVEVLDAAGNPRIKDHHMTPFTVADLLAEIKETKPGLFKAENKSGVGIAPNSGAGGNAGGVNPWAKDTWNFSEQMKLLNSKPDLAKQLKSQAGVA